MYTEEKKGNGLKNDKVKEGKASERLQRETKCAAVFCRHQQKHSVALSSPMQRKPDTTHSHTSACAGHLKAGGRGLPSVAQQAEVQPSSHSIITLKSVSIRM